MDSFVYTVVIRDNSEYGLSQFERPRYSHLLSAEPMPNIISHALQVCKFYWVYCYSSDKIILYSVSHNRVECQSFTVTSHEREGIWRALIILF